MRSVFRHALALVLALAVCTAGLPTAAEAATDSAALGISIPRTGDISPLLTARLRRGSVMAGSFYDQLSTPVQRGLYEQLAALAPIAGAVTLELDPPLVVAPFRWESAEADLRQSQVVMAIDEALNPVLTALLADRPEIFWLQERTRFAVGDASSYAVEESPGAESLTVYRVTMNPRTVSGDEEELRDMAARLDSAAAEVAAAAQGAARYQRLLSLQELVLQRLEQAPARDPSVYKDSAASLVTGVATAGGYARAFQLLCHRLGIPCVTMSSGGDYPTTWCAVQMEDGGWYIIDIYWNSASGEGQDGRFLVGTGSFPLSAEPPAHGFPYPVLEQEDYQFGVGHDVVPADAVAAGGALVYGQTLGTVRPVGEFLVADSGTPVPGRLEWLEPDAVPPAGIYEAAYQFTPEQAEYRPYAGTAPVTVEPRPLTVTPQAGSSVYNGGLYPDTPIPYACAGLVAGEDPQAALTGLLALDGRDVGARSVTQGTLAATENYTLTVARAAWTVEPRELVITWAELRDKEYDGDRQAEVLSLRMYGIVGEDEVVAHTTAELETPGAGEDKPASVVVTSLSGADSGNYVLPEPVFQTTGTVHRYGSPVCPPGRVSVPLTAGERTQRLETLTRLEGPGEAGNITYLGEPVVEHQRFFVGAPYMRDGYLYYATQSGLTPGQAATVTVEAESENYAGFRLVIQFVVEDKIAVHGTGVTVADRIYNGLPVQPEGAPVFTHGGGAAGVTGVVYRYAGAGGTIHGDPLAPPVQAGSYELVVSVAEDDPTYSGATAPIPFTIHPAELEIRPRDVEILVGEALPTAFTIQYTGLVGEDGPEVVSPTPIAVIDAVDTSIPGTAVIRIANSPAAANYNIRTAGGTLTVRAAALDSTYLRAAATGVTGWHNRAIQVEPSGKDGFDRIALSPQGPFSGSVTIDEEAAEGEKLLYLRKGEVVSGGVAFRYRLDMTAPEASCAYRQLHDRAEGLLTVTASDALSSVGQTVVTGPDGGEVAAADGGYPVTASGLYTIAVTDNAGNTATLREQVAVRRVEAVSIALAGGGNPPALVDGTAPMRLTAVVAGTARQEDYTVQWASTNPLVASVGGDGAVTFHSQGHATLTAQVMGVTAAHDLEVALSVPVNGLADGTSPSAEVPPGSVPQGVDSASLRLVVGPVSDTDRQRLTDGLEAHKSRFSGMTVSLMDIRLVDASSGLTVQPAGEITITLPLPAGADRNGQFALLHLTGSGAQLPAVSASAAGVRFRVSSLSPFALGSRAASTTDSGGRSPSGGGTTALDEEEYWDLVLEKVRGAAEGTGVAISTGRYSRVPGEVLRAAQGRAVTLTFVRSSGGNIVLYGMDLTDLDQSAAYYTLAQLEKLAADIAAKKVGSQHESDPGMPVYVPPEPTATVTISETKDGQAEVVYHQVGEGDVLVVNEQAQAAAAVEIVPQESGDGWAGIPFTVESGGSAAQRSAANPGVAVAVLLIAGAVAMAALLVWPLIRPKPKPAEGEQEAHTETEPPTV